MSVIMQYAAPAMYGVIWFLAVWMGLAGIWIVVRPDMYARIASSPALLKGMRPLGAVLMVVGAILFARADHTYLPLFIKIVGVITFIKGGVALVLPTAVQVIAEWWADRGALWLRVWGVAALVFAFALFWSVRPGGLPPQPAEEETGVLVPLEGGSAAAGVEPAPAPPAGVEAPAGANSSE